MPPANHTDRLVIERHPMQRMLRAALHARPQSCRGIFGGAEPGHITQAALADENEAMTIVTHSQPECLGVFYSAPHEHRPDPETVRHIAAELRLSHVDRCILLALDIEGRMEALAYEISNGEFAPLPLEMAEDHALSQVWENR